MPVPFIPRPLHTYIALHCTSNRPWSEPTLLYFFWATSILSPIRPLGYLAMSYVSKYPAIKVFDTRIALFYHTPFLSLIVDRNCLFPSLCPARSLLLSYPSLQEKNPLTHSSQNSANPIPSTIIKKETLLFFRTLSTVNKQPQTQKKIEPGSSR